MQFDLGVYIFLLDFAVELLPYFFCYKTEFFPSKTIYEKDRSRFLELFSKDIFSLIAEFHKTDLDICSHSGDEKTHLKAK